MPVPESFVISQKKVSYLPVVGRIKTYSSSKDGIKRKIIDSINKAITSLSTVKFFMISILGLFNDFIAKIKTIKVMINR